MLHESPDDLLTYAELRTRLRCSQRTCQKLARSGQLPSVEIGVPGSRRPRRLFRRGDVEAYIASNVVTTIRPTNTGRRRDVAS